MMNPGAALPSLSLTARLSLLFAAGAAIVLLGLGWAVERAVQSHFMEMDRQEIRGKFSLVRNLLTRARTPAALDRVPQQLDNALVGHHHLLVNVFAADGAVWYATHGTRFPGALLGDAEGDRWVEWTDGERAFRGLSARLTADDASGAATDVAGNFTVAIAQDISHHQKFMDDFRRTLAIAMALAALIAAALGWAATRAGLRPLRRVVALAASIEASRLGERLPESHVPTEIEALAVAFNAMLARLEDSFRRLSEFSSDIAHELRTPVSNLMTQTQVALSGSRDMEQYREILYSSLEEYERMAQMIGDMLFLAQADNGLLKPGQDRVDLAGETQGLFDYFGAWAEEERGVSLTMAGTASAPGDRLMLRRALSNLISNAIRHTPSGGSVRVAMEMRAGEAVISVENPGSEIPAEHLPRLFDRFYRVDPSRQRKGDGAGLGLAIVKSIVAAHGGSIAATSADGRTIFRITLPAPRA
jgi:two-component system heavy metal sensor histidine kinase CusS